MARDRREGSVYKRDSDKRWVAQLLYQDRPARPIYGRTRAEAVRKRAVAIREDDARRVGAWSRKSVRDYLAHWLLDIKGEHGPEPVKPQTRAGYARDLGHIMPYIGHRRLSDLTTAHVEDALIQLARGGMSAGRRKMIHTRLKTAFRHAVDRDYIARNPMDRLKAPIAPPAERHPFPHADMVRALAAIRGDRYEALWYLILRCGLRQSEAFALTWDDIDEERRVIHITKAVIHLPGQAVVGPPKNRSSERDVPLTDDLLVILRRHRTRPRRVVELRNPHIVFPSQSGAYLRRSTVSEHWDHLLKRHNIPHVTIHGLRHTFATLAIERGGDMHTVQALLGHARGSTVLAEHYLHARDGRDRLLMDHLGHAFEPEEAPE